MANHWGIKMQKFLGMKVVEAEPAPATDNFPRGNNAVGDPGYHIKYPDGYESWCPKDIFESAYIPVDDLDESAINFGKEWGAL
jgi:hypothetical protein